MLTRRPLRRFLATAALTLVAAPVVATVASTQGAADTGSFRVLGSLPAVKGPRLKIDRSQNILAIDAPSRRMFVEHLGTDDVEYVVTYSLKTRIPTQIGIGPAGVLGDFPLANTFGATFDSKRGNVALLSAATEMAGHSEQFDLGNVVIYSDAQHKKIAHWNLVEQLPGFVPTGITYSAKDDRYYLVGDFSANRQLSSGLGFGLKIVGPVSAVVALNPADGKVQFVKPVPECQQALYSNGIGSLIARGTMHDAVYFACVTSGSPGGTTHPGQAGLVRAFVSPTGNSADAAQWDVDFFPISGNYFAGGTASGVAAFDRTTDRFYMQSISFKTPGAFVFDGRLSAWVGFVAAEYPLNYFNGLNEGLGHFYMALSSGAMKDTSRDGIVIADVRQTPVPAGEQVKLSTGALIVADAQTRRFFMRPKTPSQPYLVVEDLTEETHPSGEDDYDVDTTDTADTPQAEVFYGLGATGYGAQTVQVGGATSPATMIGKPSENMPQEVPANTRALMMSRVGAIDLRTGSAAASGQAALPDYNTIQEYEAEHGPDSWPYAVNSCLDAGGEPTTDKTVRDEGPSGPANGGSAQVTCDAGKNLVKASARMGATGNGAVHVARTGYDAMAYRNRSEGGVVRTRASAAGVTFEMSGGYDIRFGSVITTSNVVAHGRPGTATSVWTRDVDGVRVTDATGKTIFTAPGCASKVEAKANGREQTDTCGPLATTLNRLLQTRLRLAFPMPEAAATPKGAFAGVEQTAAEYFNQSVVNDQGVVYRGDSVGLRPTPALVTEVYNDTTERSRTVTVVAATQSYAIFTIAPPYDDGWVPTDPVEPPAPPTVVAPGIVPTEPDREVPVAAPAPNAPTAPTGGTAIPIADVKGWLFLRRSLKDTALMLLLSGLVLGAAGTSWRRRRLVDVLVTVPRKEAL